MIMSLIELFTDFVVNRKDLRHYVEMRKNMHERGEFSDETLVRAQENLEKLEVEDKQEYEAMYATLKEVFVLDRGHKVEYPIDFIKEVLKMYHHGHTAHNIAQEYHDVLAHHFHDA
jgi:hypothetical protein